MQLIKKFVILFYVLILSSNVSADYLYNNESLKYTHSDYECAEIFKKEYLHYEYTLEKSENLTCFFKKKTDGSILTKQLNNYSIINDLLENKNSIDLNVLTYYNNGKNEKLKEGLKELRKSLEFSFPNTIININVVGEINSNIEYELVYDLLDQTEIQKDILEITEADFIVFSGKELISRKRACGLQDARLRGRANDFGQIKNKEDFGFFAALSESSNDTTDRFSHALIHEVGHLFGLAHDVATNSFTGEWYDCGYSENIIKDSIVEQDYSKFPFGKGIKNLKEGSASVMAYKHSEIDTNGNEIKFIEKDYFSGSFEKGGKVDLKEITNSWKKFDGIETTYIKNGGNPANNVLIETRSIYDNYLNKGINSKMALNMSIPLRISQTNRLPSTPYINMGTDQDDNIFLYNETFLGTETFVEANKGQDKYYLFSGSYDVDLSLGNKVVYIPLTNNTLNKQNIINITNYNMDMGDPLENDVIYLNQFSKENFTNNPILETIKVGDKVVGFNLNLLNSNTMIRISLDPNSYFSDNIGFKFISNSGEWSSDKEVYKDKFNIIDGGIIDDNLFELIITKNKNYYGDNNDNNLVGNEFENIFYGYGGDDILGSLFGEQWLGKDPAEIGVKGDYFVGGKDDDIIYGTRYGDSYEYMFEDGNDIIEDIGSLWLESDPAFKETIEDTLYLKGLNYNEDPKLSDVVITRKGDDVILKISKTNTKGELINNTITIKDMLLKKLYNGVEYYQNAIEIIIFDNRVLFLNDIIKAALTYHGDEGSNNYIGLSFYDNEMYGYGSNDRLMILQHSYTEEQKLIRNEHIIDGGEGNDDLCIYTRYGETIGTFKGGIGDDKIGSKSGNMDRSCYFKTSTSNGINYYTPLTKDLGQHFYGGKGNDTIYGTKFGDYYYYNLGDGIDTIYENAPRVNEFTNDKLIFTGISINNLDFLKTGNSLEVLINGVKAVMISNWYSSENYQIEEFIVGSSKYDHNYANNKGIENRNILDAE